MLKHASKFSIKLGLALSSLHLLVVLLVAISLLSTEIDSQWQLVWVPFYILDLPVSLLVIFSRELFPFMSSPWSNYPASEFHDFIAPIVVFGVLGSLWWFLIPVLSSNACNVVLGKWRRKLGDSKSD